MAKRKRTNGLRHPVATSDARRHHTRSGRIPLPNSKFTQVAPLSGIGTMRFATLGNKRNSRNLAGGQGRWFEKRAKFFKDYINRNPSESCIFFPLHCLNNTVT